MPSALMAAALAAAEVAKQQAQRLSENSRGLRPESFVDYLMVANEGLGFGRLRVSFTNDKGPHAVIGKVHYVIGKVKTHSAIRHSWEKKRHQILNISDYLCSTERFRSSGTRRTDT
eukprot:726329-Prorocentrum_minimum.AAC.1